MVYVSPTKMEMFVEAVKLIESLERERNMIWTVLDKANKRVNDLARSIDQLRQEKKVVEDEKSAQERKNEELQTSIGELERSVESMKIEEEMLSNKFANLEKKYVTICNNEAELQKEIQVLVEQKKGTEERIVSLDKEKSSITKDLEDATKELEQQKLRIEQIVHEKAKLEIAKIQADSEIIKLNEQLRVSEDRISSLEMPSANQVEKIKQLESEVNTYRASNYQAIIERDDALKSLDKEKSITSDNKEKIAIMGQEIKDLRKEVANMTTEIGEHLREKKELETRCEKLEKYVASLETKSAVEARKRKSFWTMVSFATTLLAAAASFAYVARAR